MGFLRQIGEYLFLVKRDPNQERTGMMKAMHGMNRISLIVFLIGITIVFGLFLLKTRKLYKTDVPLPPPHKTVSNFLRSLSVGC